MWITGQNYQLIWFHEAHGSEKPLSIKGWHRKIKHKARLHIVPILGWSSQNKKDVLVEMESLRIFEPNKKR